MVIVYLYGRVFENPLIFKAVGRVKEVLGRGGGHSLIEIVWPLQLKSHCYCFCLHLEFYNTAIDGTHKDQKIVSLTEEIRFIHLRGS